MRIWAGDKPTDEPGQNLVEVTVGEWMMNSSVFGSNVAVVSNPRTNVP